MGHLKLFLILAILPLFRAETVQCPFYTLNESFFGMGKPAYLKTPVIQKTLDICSGQYGKLSCCDSTTLKQISSFFNTYKADITTRASKSMKVFKSLFDSILKYDFTTNMGDYSGKRMNILMQKELILLKTRFVYVNVAMSKCFRRLNQVANSFLCMGCNPNTTVTVSSDGKTLNLPVKQNSINKLESSCGEYINKLTEVVDDYYRKKMIIYDYIAAEMGEASDDCTCSGANRDKDSYTITTASSRLLADSLQFGGSVDYNFTSSVKSLKSPYSEAEDYVARQIGNDTTLNTAVDKIISSVGVTVLKAKQYKRAVLESYPNLILAIFNRIDSAVINQQYEAIWPALNDFMNLDDYTFNSS